MPVPRCGGAVIFGRIGNACSICAPRDMDGTGIEEAVNRVILPATGRFRVGSSAPTPCEHSLTRQHWLVINRGPERV